MKKGYLQNTNSKMERAILVSPKDLYNLVYLMKEHQSKLVMGPNDHLIKILNQISLNNEIPANRPTLLKVESKDERRKFSLFLSRKRNFDAIFFSLQQNLLLN